MAQKICSKSHGHNKQEFYCEKCDYTCHTSFLFKQHCSTKKHQKSECSKMLKKYANEYKCECGRIYKHIQSYNRHIKTCKIELSQCQNSEKEELRGMISTLISQNQNMLMENKEMRDLVKDMIPKIGSNNTTITNKFNWQFFLNEQCKDAINLTDFVETLKLSLADLAETRQNGYITGITNIFVRGLRELELHKRPIHCSDLKREILYVKDNDTWEKDNEDKQMVKNAISTVAKRQINKIKEWEAVNPDWNKSENGTQMYIEMVRNLGGCNDDRADNKIIKTIAKETIIEK
tara:strand:- start:876 stop:1748 length:873 start_codon:yes stop_codon:yes gene_type:complete